MGTIAAISFGDCLNLLNAKDIRRYTMDHIFYNKDGSCTKYALACGYMQRIGNVQLYREHECYHIVRSKDNGFGFERSATYSLTEARKMFRLARTKDRSDAKKFWDDHLGS
jgi:hypothetical protein